MQDKKIKIVEVTGSLYEVGLQLGELFKKRITSEITKYMLLLENSSIKKKLTKLETKIKEIYPNCLDEVYGRADGARVPRDALLLMYSPEFYQGIDGCTTVIMKKGNGNVLFAHNEDNGPIYHSQDTVAFVKYNIGDEWFVAYSMFNKLAGNTFEYNSHGMVFTYNYLEELNINLDNVSRYFMARDIMLSRNIEEVLEKCNKVNIASAFSINVLDLKIGRVINIEKDNSNVYITEIKDFYARSNHFLSENRKDIKNNSNTLFRHKKANELMNELTPNESTIDDLIEILKYNNPHNYDECIYKDIENFKNLPNTMSRTQATFGFDSKSKTIIIYDYIGKRILSTEYNQFPFDEKPL